MLNVWLLAMAASKADSVRPRSCTIDWLVSGFHTARNTSDVGLVGLLIAAKAAGLPSVTAAAAKHSRLKFNMREILHLRKFESWREAKVMVDLRNGTISAL